LNEAGVVEPTVRDNVESGGYNKSFHNIPDFQTLHNVCMLLYGGRLFHTRWCQVDNIAGVCVLSTY